MTELDLNHALHVVERAVQQAKLAQDQSAAETARQQARAEHLQTRLTLERERVKELEKQLAAVSRPPTPHNRSALGIHMGRSRDHSKMNRRHTTPPSSLPCTSSDAVVASLLQNAHLQERLAQQCEELEKLRTALADLQEEQRTKLASAVSTDGDPMSPSSQRRSTLPLSRLWDMLDRAVNLQRATLNEVAEAAEDGTGYDRRALQADEESPTSSYDDTDGEEEQEVSLADDGSAGVGATAAAAVSVALAQSWAATARHTALHGDATTFGWSSQGGPWSSNGLPKGGSDNNERGTVAMDTGTAVPTAHDVRTRPDNDYSPSSLPKSPNATPRRRPVLIRRDPRSETSKKMGYGRAKFKLVAAVPRARRTKEAGAPVPLSALPARLTLLPTESHVALDSLADAERSAMDENQEAEWRACGSHLKLQWLSPPRSALVACKPSEVESPHTVRAVLWLLSRGMTVWVDPSEHGRMLDAVLRVMRLDADGNSGHDDSKGDDAHNDDDVFKQPNRSMLGSKSSSLSTSTIISARSLQQFVSDDSSSSLNSSTANLLQSAPMDEISRAVSPACGLSSSRRLTSSQRSGAALAGRPPSAPGGGARTVDPGEIDLDVQLRTWLPQQPWEQRGPCVALAAKAAAEDPEQRRNEDGVVGDGWGAGTPDSPQQQASSTSLSSEPDGPTPLPLAVAAAIDVVVSLGGDGTLLWACGLFGDGAVPPIVSFAMGSLGFMTPFPAARIATVLSRVTSTAHGFPLMLRHRLQGVILRGNYSREGAATPCQSPPLMVLNELVIDRGTTPFLTNLHVYADGAFVTVVQGDGLILATPTGSTAYSLAAGGSMVHPGVPCLLFTPICAHTLSSRPLVFPEHVTLTIMVPSDARAGAYISFDGKHRARLAPGDGVAVRASQWPVPTVCNLDASNDWFRSVRDGLNWNTRVVQGHADN